MFFRGSRYESIPEAEWETPDGRVLRYKRRRVIPETPAPLGTETRPGDRPRSGRFSRSGRSRAILDALRRQPADAPGAADRRAGPDHCRAGPGCDGALR